MGNPLPAVLSLRRLAKWKTFATVRQRFRHPASIAGENKIWHPEQLLTGAIEYRGPTHGYATVNLCPICHERATEYAVRRLPTGTVDFPGVSPHHRYLGAGFRVRVSSVGRTSSH
jgi:hypothetical protein